jgi:CheY-like chemotaxis protein
MDIKLLIIDDDPVHHKLVELVIHQSALRIEYQSFFHASDGLAYILDNNDIISLPDLVLLDLDMPLISGWGFLELLEAMSPCLGKQIDIIILTSSISLADKEKASTYNCVKGFFSKPFNNQILQDIINSPFASVNKAAKYYNN